VPYYVFVVRGDGVRSTTYPNVFGVDVTFTCASATTGDDDISLTSCRVVRNSVGRYILQVNGVNFRPNNTVILLNGQPCRRNRYPSRFISPSDGTTTRINCSGGLRQALPAVVTARLGLADPVEVPDRRVHRCDRVPVLPCVRQRIGANLGADVDAVAGDECTAQPLGVAVDEALVRCRSHVAR